MNIIKLFFFAIFLSSTVAYAAEEMNVDSSGIMLHGYDPVSYFDGPPQEGNANLEFIYQGATFRFSTEQNLAKFRQNPAQYMPQFGGYCAYGVRVGKKLDIDPTIYTILDGKLYVLLNRATLLVWEQEHLRNIKIGNKLWSSIQSSPAQLLENQ